MATSAAEVLAISEELLKFSCYRRFSSRIQYKMDTKKTRDEIPVWLLLELMGAAAAELLESGATEEEEEELVGHGAS